jgi:hypothetical protein
LSPDSETQTTTGQQSSQPTADDDVADDDALDSTMLTGDENPEGNTSIYDHFDLSKLTGDVSDDDDDDEASSHVKLPKYMIVVDHSHKSIVMAIRGTMSINDIITDLLCENVPLLGGWSHQGNNCSSTC